MNYDKMTKAELISLLVKNNTENAKKSLDIEGHEATIRQLTFKLRDTENTAAHYSKTLMAIRQTTEAIIDRHYPEERDEDYLIVEPTNPEHRTLTYIHNMSFGLTK